MPTSLSELELSASQLRKLKVMRTRKSVPTKAIDKHKNTKYRYLFYYALIEHDPTDYSKYRLSMKAENYLRLHARETYKFYIPLVVSLISLLLSVIAIIVSIMK